MLRNLKAQTCAGFTVLAIVLSGLAGCTTVEQAVHKSSPFSEPSVARLGDGRDGFVIREVPEMDGSSRRDFDRAVALLEEQDYERAVDLLEKIIERAPGVTAPYIDIAIAYQHLGKPDQAEEHLKTALELFPGHPVACNEYGLLYRKSGRFAEARAVYEKAIARFPDYYPVHRNLGILCDLYLNDPACALNHYEIYGEARPQDKQVKMWIADLRSRLERQEEGR